MAMWDQNGNYLEPNTPHIDGLGNIISWTDGSAVVTGTAAPGYQANGTAIQVAPGTYVSGSAGYGAGGAGAGTTPGGSAGSYSGASSQYRNPYQSQIDRLAGLIESSKYDGYNPEEDPLYANYADLYTRNGRMAMRDTMANATAQTGGMMNSYAVTAAQQAQNDWNARLQGIIPELADRDYGLYLDQLNGWRDDLSLYASLGQQEYERWAAERDYQLALQQLAMEQANRASGYVSYGGGSSGGSYDTVTYDSGSSGSTNKYSNQYNGSTVDPTAAEGDDWFPNDAMIDAGSVFRLFPVRMEAGDLPTYDELMQLTSDGILNARQDENGYWQFSLPEGII